MAGGTSTCDTSTLKFVSLPFPGQPHGHGIGRRGRLEADGEEDDLPIRIGRGQVHGIERRIDDAHVAALRFELQQIAVRAGHAQHVAEGAEDDVGPGGDGVGPVDHLQRRDADRTAGAVHQLARPSGKMRSRPYLTMVCVWPPQTSMMVHGRGHRAAMAAASLRAARVSRYSSRYFMADGDLEFVQLVHLVQEFEDALGLRLVDRVEGEADVDQHVFADLRLRHMFQADALEDAAEIDLAHEDVVFAIGFHDFAGNAQTHVVFPLCVNR